MANFGYIPYCGLPPVPGDVAWNVDPAIILVIVALAGAHLRAARSGMMSAAAGWALILAAFVSPLCNLGIALFSARVAQHMLVTLVAAPLIALATVPAIDSLRRRLMPDARAEAAAAALSFAVALWAWHAPDPYAATLGSDFIYWAMHISLAGSAIWLWRVLLDPNTGPATTATTSGATAMHMGLLGALLTFMPAPVYAPHFATTLPWGLSPLADQQLGGLIMWVPTGVLLLAVLAILVGMQVSREDAIRAES